jgi:hypothetical protein
MWATFFYLLIFDFDFVFFCFIVSTSLPLVQSGVSPLRKMSSIKHHKRKHTSPNAPTAAASAAPGGSRSTRAQNKRNAAVKPEHAALGIRCFLT